MSAKGSYWAKVLFMDFISHFRKMSDEQIAADIRESMDALEAQDDCKGCFGSKMVKWANDRKASYKNVAANGSNGGRPRKALVPVENQLAFGEFANVMLTQEQFNDLAVRVGNMNEAKSMVESLSCKLEDGSIVSDNHYATLCSWANYRKEKATTEPHYESVDEHNKRVYREAMQQLGYNVEEQ